MSHFQQSVQDRKLCRCHSKMLIALEIHQVNEHLASQTYTIWSQYSFVVTGADFKVSGTQKSSRTEAPVSDTPGHSQSAATDS